MIHQNYQSIVTKALKEDIGRGDITAKIVPVDLKVQADIVVKSKGVLCGMGIAKEVLRQVNKNLTLRVLRKDGALLKKSTIVAHIYGKAQDILTAERVMLNFLSFLSGVATQTYGYVQAVKPYKVKILDTRKTIPNLRALQRYAVLCGGGANHRFNLNDMALVKDNHLMSIKGYISVQEAIAQLKKVSKKPVEVEVDNLEQLAECLLAKADIILLDNMTPVLIKQAVKMRNRLNKKALLEASGGINLENVRQYAAAGVDRISIGALTHTINPLDIGLDFAYKS